jgi:hypothetical protein
MDGWNLEVSESLTIKMSLREMTGYFQVVHDLTGRPSDVLIIDCNMIDQSILQK